MKTIKKVELRNIFEENKTYIYGEIAGLSTDSKPTTINGKLVDNGSIFIEMDTSKIYFYDLANQTWREFTNGNS